MPMFVQAPTVQQQPTLMFYAAQQQAAPPPVWTANEPPLGCSAPGKKKTSSNAPEYPPDYSS